MTVIAIGGSILLQENRTLRKDVVSSYIDIIERNSDSVDALVLGGGSIASEYIEMGESMGLSSESLDEIGISVTTLNAKLFCELLSIDVEYAATVQEAGAIHGDNRIPVMGGTEPGHTTDAVATLVADSLGSERVLFVSDVDGIYDTRGGVGVEGAKLYDEVETEELRQIVSTLDDSPGRSVPVDRRAVNILEESNIVAFMFNGLQVSNFEKLMQGKQVGTKIKPS